MSFEFTPEQQRAADTIAEWFNSIEARFKPLTLGGYAGTGKTTLIGKIPSFLPGQRIIYVSYTGKAVSVLRRKLPPGAAVATIHRTLYHPHQRKVCKASGEDVLSTFCEKHNPYSKATDAELERLLRPPEPCEVIAKLEWSEQLNPLDGVDLVVVDEASMVSDTIWHDLTKWHVPVLAVGDHGQLPPIRSEFNLMRNPQIRLETILRQVADSPIIKMATIARETGRLRFGSYGAGGKKIPRSAINRIPLEPSRGDVVICAYNKTRNATNEAIRRAHQRTGPPRPGDIVICLRNSYEQGIFNGQRGVIRDIYEGDPYTHTAMAEIDMTDDGFTFYGRVSLDQFGQPKTLSTIPRRTALFDYGYAITAHKAQGSEFPRALVIEERLPSTDHKRWLYTAITRASDKLIVAG